MKKVTIKDIAAYCQVSITTVSWVINGQFNELSPETISKVQDAIEKLGYKRNEVARSLVTNKSNTIAVIIPDITNRFYAAIIKQVNKVAIENGYNILLCDTDNSLKLEEEQVNLLDNRLIDGLIIASRNSKKILSNFDNSRSVPIVVIDEQIYIDDKNTTIVTTDNKLAGEKISDYVISFGHEKIFVLGGLKDSTNTKMRFEGFKESLTKNNIPIKYSKIEYADYKKDKAYDIVRGQFSEDYTAIIAFNDLMAYGALNALKDMNIKKISVAAFDAKSSLDLFGNLTNYDLTSINQDETEIANIATKVLLESINGNNKKVNNIIYIPSYIHEGNTIF